ncbi:MAG TPA: LytR C-terminal domain-containing protein [Solirubrobacteraceae bacterium]
MPLALSVHNFITSVGADVGFASIIGLAILTLLFFTQHRETANIRRESEELSQRLAQAESRLAVLSRQPAPAPAPSAATQSPQPTRATSPPIRAVRAGASAVGAPAAPAGVAAPPLAAATRVVPVGAPPAPQRDGEQFDAAPAAPAVAADADTAFEPQGEEVFAGAAPRAVAASAPVRERTAGPSPATAAGGANGGGARAVAPGDLRQGPPRPRDRAQVRSAAPSAQSRRPAPPPRAPARNERGTGRRFVFLIGGLVLIAVIAVLVIVTQSGGSNSSNSRQASTSNAPDPAHHKAASVFKPSSVTVAVLNGTATNELAHHVATKLTGAGYKQGTVATASNQAVSSTVVAYLPGDRNDALRVATALKLGSAVVQPIDQQTQTVACPPPSSCTANVVVTVGQDLSTL